MMNLTRNEQVAQLCSDLGNAAMIEVESLAAGDDLVFRYGLCVVIQRLQEHLAINLAHQIHKREFFDE
jgi:hypothetical protein